MTTKQRLKLAWDQLSDIAKNYSDLTPAMITLLIIEAEQYLAEARRLVYTGGFTPVYAIGIEHQPREFGMTNGPTPDLKEMLSFIPIDIDADKYCLFRFEGEKNVLTHRWSIQLGRWVAEPTVQ